MVFYYTNRKATNKKTFLVQFFWFLLSFTHPLMAICTGLPGWAPVTWCSSHVSSNHCTDTALLIYAFPSRTSTQTTPTSHLSMPLSLRTFLTLPFLLSASVEIFPTRKLYATHFLPSTDSVLAAACLGLFLQLVCKLPVDEGHVLLSIVPLHPAWCLETRRFTWRYALDFPLPAFLRTPRR